MSISINKTPEGKIFAIVQHESDEGGPGKVLLDYLRGRSPKKIYHFAHPNLYIKSGYGKASRKDVYLGKALSSSRTGRTLHLPEPLLYVKDCMLTLYWILSGGDTVDVFIGLGNINAFCGIVLKSIGRVNKVVYYVIDYVPDRFKNRMLNSLYHRIEKYAAEYSDSTWNISGRIIEAREKTWKKHFPSQRVVPHGLYLSPDGIRRAKNIHGHSLVYLGYLNKEQGLDLILESLPSVKKYIPDITLSIIGTGNYEREARELTRNLGLSKCVRFYGLVKDAKETEKILSGCSVGLAMYRSTHKFSFYSDPGKIKHYLSVGLPIIMTGLPSVASVIREQKCGIVIPDDRDSFVRAVRRMFSTESVRYAMHVQAVTLAGKFEWKTVLTEAFRSVL